MDTVKDAGLGITGFTSHSTRSSSTSKAHIKGFSLTMINKSAGWTTDSSFAKFYNTPDQSVIKTQKLNIFYCVGNKNNFYLIVMYFTNIVIDLYYIDIICLFNILVNFLTLNYTQITSSGPVKKIVE